MKYILYKCILGILTIKIENNVIRGVTFGRDVEIGRINEDPVIGMKVHEEFDAYFAGILRKFSLDFRAEGTEFQNLVWDRILEIPYGETRTYKEIAEEIGRPNSARAVGNACNSNKIPIIIPCHRVLGSRGRLTGYAGGLEAKQYLLDLEKNSQRNN